MELKSFLERIKRELEIFTFPVAKQVRERELFALGLTTGTVNEKRRTLRKSIPVQTFCTRNALNYTEESSIQLIITVRAEYVQGNLS